MSRVSSPGGSRTTPWAGRSSPDGALSFPPGGARIRATITRSLGRGLTAGDQISGAAGTLSTMQVVELYHDPWVGETVFWTRDTDLPGMGVEFRNQMPGAHITSSSTPPGGASFDSGPMGPGKRLHFVPDVAGTWKFVDRLSGTEGAFTVQP
jgi:hypothetical protein